MPTGDRVCDLYPDDFLYGRSHTLACAGTCACQRALNHTDPDPACPGSSIWLTADANEEAQDIFPDHAATYQDVHSEPGAANDRSGRECMEGAAGNSRNRRF